MLWWWRCLWWWWCLCICKLFAIQRDLNGKTKATGHVVKTARSTVGFGLYRRNAVVSSVTTEFRENPRKEKTSFRQLSGEESGNIQSRSDFRNVNTEDFSQEETISLDTLCVASRDDTSKWNEKPFDLNLSLCVIAIYSCSAELCPCPDVSGSNFEWIRNTACMWILTSIALQFLTSI